MQLRQLEIFVQVVRHSSFSKAGQALFLTQPTVSSHIHALEKELGTRLFHRSPRELTLTPQGRILYAYASQIVHFCARAQSELDAYEQKQQNHLFIAASSVPSQYLLPRVLPTVQKQFPHICFHLAQGDSDFAIQAVHGGEAEVGFAGSRENKENLKYDVLLEEQLAAVTPNLPLYQAMKGVMKPEVLQTAPFLMREPGSGTRKSMEDFLTICDVQLDRMRVAAEMSGTECVLKGVECGLGISIVSQIAAESYAEGGKILVFPFPDNPVRRRFYMVTRRDVPLSAAALCLMKAFRAMDFGAFSTARSSVSIP